MSRYSATSKYRSYLGSSSLSAAAGDDGEDRTFKSKYLKYTSVDEDDDPSSLTSTRSTRLSKYSASVDDDDSFTSSYRKTSHTSYRDYESPLSTSKRLTSSDSNYEDSSTNYKVTLPSGDSAGVSESTRSNAYLSSYSTSESVDESSSASSATRTLVRMNSSQTSKDAVSAVCGNCFPLPFQLGEECACLYFACRQWANMNFSTFAPGHCSPLC